MPTNSKNTLAKEELNQKNKNNRLLSLVSLIAPFIMLPVVGIVAGHVALKEYGKDDADKTWKPLALAGTISGYVVLFVKINLIIMLGAFLSLKSYSYTNHYDMPCHHGMSYPYMMESQSEPYFEDYQMEIQPKTYEGYGMGSGMSMEGKKGTLPLEDGTLMFIDGIPMPPEVQSNSR